jgi:hypothetical protein
MTTPTNADDQPTETPGGSSISDPEVINDPADNGSGDSDKTGDDLDAPDPA